MTDFSVPSNPKPERVSLSEVDDLRDVIHRAVACLAQGGVVALPTESVYMLAASALRPDAVARIRELRGVRDGTPFGQVRLRGASELLDWIPDLSSSTQRLANRAWPGPVTFLVEGKVAEGLAGHLDPQIFDAVADKGALRLGCPLHPIVREIASLLAGPIFLSPARRTEGPDPITADPLADWSGVDMLLDDGPTELSTPPTLVRLSAEGWRVEQPGAVDEAMLRRFASTIILFVCTGNTCRSPMAEALFKAKLAERLGCTVNELEDRGFVVLSAGLSAINGLPAAVNAVEVAREWGGMLDHHASQPVTPELIRQADLVLAMTSGHLETLLYHMPEAASHARLLDAEGFDIEDPIGSDLENYRQTAHEIERHLGRLLDELGV